MHLSTITQVEIKFRVLAQYTGKVKCCLKRMNDPVLSLIVIPSIDVYSVLFVEWMNSGWSHRINSDQSHVVLVSTELGTALYLRPHANEINESDLVLMMIHTNCSSVNNRPRSRKIVSHKQGFSSRIRVHLVVRNAFVRSSKTNFLLVLF